MVPDDKINTFVEKLRTAAGGNLESVILYGSAASGNYHSEFSDVNLFCVLHDCSYTALCAVAPVVKWWNRQKQPPPLLMTREELQRSTDVFAIELTDMVQHHRVLWGQDVIATLKIPMHLHRVQVEYELREKSILLRQHLLLAEENERKVRELLLRSLPSFTTLFRHALIALGESAPGTRREAVERLAVRLGFDPMPLAQLLDVREHRAEAGNLRAVKLVGPYLESVDKVTAAIDKIEETKASGPS